jgi:hypothetical protein
MSDKNQNSSHLEVEYLFAGFKRVERYQMNARLAFLLNTQAQNGKILPAIQSFGIENIERERFYMHNGVPVDLSEDEPYHQIIDPQDGSIMFAFNAAGEYLKFPQHTARIIPLYKTPEPVHLEKH